MTQTKIKEIFSTYIFQLNENWELPGSKSIPTVQYRRGHGRDILAPTLV